jgi:hypothetical protein
MTIYTASADSVKVVEKNLPELDDGNNNELDNPIATRIFVRMVK